MPVNEGNEEAAAVRRHVGVEIDVEVGEAAGPAQLADAAATLPDGLELGPIAPQADGAEPLADGEGDD